MVYVHCVHFHDRTGLVVFLHEYIDKSASLTLSAVLHFAMYHY